MPISYNVRPNKLTNPPSYWCQYEAGNVLGNDQIAELINSADPTIPAATASAVIDLLRQIVLERNADGDSVVLKNFVSFVPSISANLAIATDPLPPEAASANAKIPRSFQADFRNLATYNRLGYPTKAPSIVTAYEASTESQKWARPGYGLKLSGSNIGFDQAQADEGIFAESPGLVEVKQENIVTNDPSNIAVVFEEDAGDAANAVEYKIFVRTRYTPGGDLREGSFEYVRKTNAVGVGSAAIFQSRIATGFASVTQHNGVAELGKIVARKTPLGKYYLNVETLAGVAGPEVEVTAAGDYVLTGLSFDTTVNISNLANFQAVVEGYGNYIVEYALLDLIP